MNKHNRSLLHLKLFFIILFSFSLFTSCKKENKEDVKEPENVCTLTPEQLPEVRGFRLRMSYDDLKRRFPNFCPLSKDNSNVHSIKPYKPSRNNSFDLPKDCWEVNIESHPELEGVSEIRLSLWKGLLSKFLIKYDKTTDEKFDFTFRRTMKDALGLSQFTNWGSSNSVDDVNDWVLGGIPNPRGEQLLCDKLNIAIGMGRYIYEKSPTEYNPFIEIRETNRTAVTKAQAEQEKRAAEDKDKEKRETFKP